MGENTPKQKPNSIASHPSTLTVYINMKITHYEWNPEGDFEKWLEENIK